MEITTIYTLWKGTQEIAGVYRYDLSDKEQRGRYLLDVERFKNGGNYDVVEYTEVVCAQELEEAACRSGVHLA